MDFAWTQKDSKVLKLLLDDSSVISIQPTNRIKVGYGQYRNEIELPRSTADKLNRSSTAKILTTGKLKDEVELTQRVLKIFKVIYQVMYN